jgi:hypothetical protein
MIHSDRCWDISAKLYKKNYILNLIIAKTVKIQITAAIK